MDVRREGTEQLQEPADESTVDRRTFLRWMGLGSSLVAVGPLVAACGDDAPAPTAAPTTAAATTQPATTEATTAATQASTTAATVAPGTTAPPPPPDLPPQVIRLGIDGSIQNFDYHKQFNLTDSWAPSQIFRGLSDLDPVTYRYVTEQAVSWEHSDDYLDWTFTIRPGIMFHNGREMTASDVVFSTMRVLDEETGSPYRAYFVDAESGESNFVSMEADGHTLDIRLASPNPRLEELFFVHVNAIMPEEVIADINTNPVGTGPFRFREHVPDVATVLEKNPDYWEEGLPHLDEIQMIPIPDEVSRLAALRSGELDWIRNPPRAEIPSLQNDDSLNVQVLPSSWVDWFRISTRYPPLDNHNVRLAIAMAVNRDAANERALFGLGVPAYTNVPPLTNVPLDINPPPYDPEGARALLEQEGAAGFELELIAHGVAHIPKIAESVAADLQAVGIDARAVEMEEGFWAERWSQKDWQMASSASISFIDPGPRSRFAADNDVGGWADEEIQEWLASAAATGDVAERSRLYSMMWNKFLNEGTTFIAITAAPYAAAMSKKVKGFPMFPEQQQRWETVWLDSDA